MALAYAHGAIQWLAADAATTTYPVVCTDVVSGATFQPKALRFQWIGAQSATDIITTTVNLNRGTGFAKDASTRRCVGSFSADNQGTTLCATMARDDAIACTTDSAAANDGTLDLSTLNADGFTAIVDNQPTNNITVFWEAWAGSDINSSNVSIVDISEPAATGDVDYTATGFLPGAEDQVVMFAGCQDSNALNTGLNEASGYMIGYATGPGREQSVITGNADDGVAGNSDCDGAGLAGQCIGMIIRAGAAVLQARASLTQFNAGGFRLNWAARGITSRKYIAMAIKGGSWYAGNCVASVNAINDTAKVAGLRFKPIGVEFISIGDAEQAVDVATAPDAISYGCASSTSSRRVMGNRDRTAITPTEIYMSIQYDQMFVKLTNAGADDGALDISSMNADGFTLICDTATTGSAKNMFIGFLAFGDAGDYSGSLSARAKDQPMIRGPM